jgi:hypothetical protein
LVLEADVVGEELAELLPLDEADVVEFDATPDPPVTVKYAL